MNADVGSGGGSIPGPGIELNSAYGAPRPSKNSDELAGFTIPNRVGLPLGKLGVRPNAV